MYAILMTGLLLICGHVKAMDYADAERFIDRIHDSVQVGSFGGLALLLDTAELTEQHRDKLKEYTTPSQNPEDRTLQNAHANRQKKALIVCNDEDPNLVPSYVRFIRYYDAEITNQGQTKQQEEQLVKSAIAKKQQEQITKARSVITTLIGRRVKLGTSNTSVTAGFKQDLAKMLAECGDGYILRQRNKIAHKKAQLLAPLTQSPNEPTQIAPFSSDGPATFHIGKASAASNSGKASKSKRATKGPYEKRAASSATAAHPSPSPSSQAFTEIRDETNA